LSKLKLDDYVIGKRTPTFCTHIEVNTKPWASILGATAFKFGIYFGRTRAESRKKYRFSERFGSRADQAFANVKRALVDVVEAGRSLDFEAVDRNPLTQMFKAKILSLYLPDKFLNVCSKEHIETLAVELGYRGVSFVSQQQHLLLEAKLSHPLTERWSNPKAMTFLYNTFIHEPKERMHLRGQRKKRNPPKIDIEQILENRKRIGEMSERYAKRWERERLRGFGVTRPRIDDLRKNPSCGYDFLSHDRDRKKRYIEVKTAGRNRIEGGYRFFLSDTQKTISQKNEFSDEYYIYLVYYSDDGKPNDLEEWKAVDLYAISEFSPSGYIVSFEREAGDR
jgi:hypothetical protein